MKIFNRKNTPRVILSERSESKNPHNITRRTLGFLGSARNDGKRGGVLSRARLSSILALAVSLLCCLALGFTGVFGGFKKAEANVNTDVIILDNNRGTILSNSYKTLLKKIGGSSVNSYSDLDNELGASETKNATIATTVTLGGYKWNVVYVSRAAYGKSELSAKTKFNNGSNAVGDKGDIIVTLWLADTTLATAGINAPACKYNLGISYLVNITDSNGDKFPTNMYSSSYIRSRLNGTNYAKYNDTENTITNGNGAVTIIAGTQDAAWTKITDNLGKYLSTPAQMSWQYRQREDDPTGFAWNKYPYDSPSTGLDGSNSNFHTSVYTSQQSYAGYENFGNVSSATNYEAWGDDKIWLPSHWEIGSNDSTRIGLWHTAQTQRAISSGTRYWLRGSSFNAASSCWNALADGSDTGYGSFNGCKDDYLTRPAIHLNLKVIEKDLVEDLYDESTQSLSKSELSVLYSKIAGKEGATVDDVKKLLNKDNGYQYSASDIRTDNAVTGNKDSYVYFGGLWWTVTYVSKSKTGNLVATLWLESSTINGVNQTTQFNNWVSADSGYSAAALSCIYGTSYLRSYLNGTPYMTGTTGAMNAAGAANAYWKTFRDIYGKFIIEPLYMSWQETENQYAIAGTGFTGPNDAWGMPQGETNWHPNGSTDTSPAPTKIGYSAWAVDKLWIPSVTEMDCKYHSMWNLSTSQLQNGTSTATTGTECYWIRTGRGKDSRDNCVYNGNGATGNAFATTGTYAIRPAIHLNISGDATDLWNDGEKQVEDFTLDALMQNLTSATSNKTTISSSYKDLDDLLKATASGVMSSADIRTNNYGSDINVKFGGMHWDLTYLSRTRTGDIIATLWLDSTRDAQQWSKFSNASTAVSYPSNMYSSSYIRAYLNGTPYTTNGTSLTSGAAVQNAVWKNFILNYGNFLTTPAQVAWQEKESSVMAGINQGTNLPNEAYGVPSLKATINAVDSSGYYYVSGSINTNYTAKDGYSNWKNDKIWLPSFCETGGDTRVGIWQTTESQRRDTYGSLLRSGRVMNATDMAIINPNTNAAAVAVTSTGGVRPAIHLNLTRIKDLLTPVIANGVATEDGANNTLTYNGEAQEVINSIFHDLTRVSYEVQFTGFDGRNAGYYANAGGDNLAGGGIFVENGSMFATAAGKYTVTFTLRRPATTSGLSNYVIAKDADGWNNGDVWAGIDDDVKTVLNERVESVVIYFEIKPVVLQVEWGGDLTATYDGQPRTVTATPNGVLGGESVSLTIGYGNGIITPVNAGEYTATATLDNGNYILKYTDADGFEAYGYSVTCPVKIEKATVEAAWTTATEFAYNGGEQGAEITALTGLCDDDATNAALLAAVKGNVGYYTWDPSAALGTTGVSDAVSPIHTGGYVAVVTLNGLTGFENYELSSTGAEFKFKIIPAEVTASYTSGDGTFTREFDGKKLAVDADGFETLATGDDAENIFVIKYRLATAADAEENWSLEAPVFGEYIAKAFDIADGDYKVTNWQTITIGKRQINIIWSGDDKSVITTYNGGELLTWLYDGSAHAPAAAVDKDDLDGVVDSNGNAVNDLKIEVVSTRRSAAGSWTTTVGLAAADFNKYFTLVGTSCDYRIAKLELIEVKWYAHGDIDGATLEDGVSFQKTEVFGTYGPEIKAYGAGTLSGKDSEGNAKTVVSVIELSVAYNASFSNEYWTVGNYTATAGVTVGGSNADFAAGLDRVLDFTVTEQKIEVKEITVVWGLMQGSTFAALTDELVMTFTGYAPALVAKADGATGANLPVNAGSLVADVGTHTAYIDLKDSSTVIYKNFECPYEITPLKVKLSWVEAEWFYTGGTITPKATIDPTYVPDGTDAQEYADILQGVADLKLNAITVTGATNAGTHTAVASMSENFEIVEGSESFEFTISKFRLDISKVVWSSDDENSVKYDEDMNMYFSWANDGTAHAPKAELTATIGGRNKQIKLTVNGATSATGTHYATALLDSLYADNNNFILGRYETTDDGAVFVPCGAECKFVIVQFEVGDIYWVTGANEGADVSPNGADVLTFTYNGRGQCPIAYYLVGEEKIWLDVWGEMTDAGEYIAYVSENFAFKNEGSDKCAFVILPQELEVRWQYDAAESPITYNGTAQSPTVKLFDSDGKEFTALSDGNGYSVLKFTEAGEHVAEISFINGNYTYKAGTNEKAFTIEKYKINVTFTSSNDQGYEMTSVWTYKATKQGPSVRDVTVYLAEGGTGITFGESSGHRIIVTGRESDVGVYTVAATLDDLVADNANFELINATREYEIVAHRIVVNWKDAGSEGNFTWTYSGKIVCPTATYQDWTGATKNATVMGGNSSAGTYTASVVLPANCEFMYENGHQYSGTHEFTVKRAAVTEIVWYTDDTYEHEIEGGVASYVFDGEMHLPAAKIKSTGAELIVTGARRIAGEGYIATAALSDAGNYVLDEANANKTMRFNVTPMPVFIKWIGNEDADDEFVWTYTGGFICPTAVLTVRDEYGDEVIVTENGRYVYVTVSGGAVSAGNEYVAIAADNLANYDFETARHRFEIKPKELEDFEWNAMGANVDDGEVAGGGYCKYTYTYNGKTQRPLLSLDNNAAGVKFGYRINKYDGTDIGDIAETVNAGLYLLTVYATDGNYALPEGAESVVVEIERRTAIVQWSAISADGETKSPEAWFFDADNQAVKLNVTVTSDGVETGSDGKVILKFKASVSPGNGNYDFTGDMGKDFTMVVTSSGDVTWDFENGKWTAVPAEPVTPPSGGSEGGETGGSEGGEVGEETGDNEGGTEGGSIGETGESGEEGSEGGEIAAESDGTDTDVLKAETSVKTMENRAIAADNQQLIAEDKKSFSNLLDEE